MGNNHYRGRVKGGKKDRSVKKATWLIFCEGEKTEVNYLNSLEHFLNSKLNDKFSVKFKIEPIGKNAIETTNKAIKYIKKADNIFENVFAFFDKDDLSGEQFNKSIFKCNNTNIEPIWSNESFELWYLLHYINIQSAISRNDYENKLTENMDKEYKKESKEMFSLTYKNLEKAYIRCKKLQAEQEKETNSPSKMNPNTQMNKFIDKVNDNLKEINCTDIWQLINKK